MFNRKTCSDAMLVMLLLAFAAGCSVPMATGGQPAPGAPTPMVKVSTDEQGHDSLPRETLLTWEGRMTIGDNDIERCHRLSVTADHRALFGPCSAAPSTTQFSPPQWDEMITRFASFEYSAAETRITFRGQGQVAGPAWQHAIANWAQDTYARLLTGRACAACGTVMNWSFGPLADQPGRCSNLWVTNYGYAYRGQVPCAGGQAEIVAQGWLETDEWAKLDAWLSGRAETYMGEGRVNYLAGRGQQVMSEAEQSELERWAHSVNVRLTSSGSAKATIVPSMPPTPSATSTPDAAQAQLTTFETRLKQALIARDYSDLRTLMSDEFMVVFWLSDGHPYSPQQAVEELRQKHIGAKTELTFHAIQDLLGAQDAVQSLFRPQVNVVKQLYVQGWGQTGRDEAILYIARRPDGSLYWHGIVAAPGRFAGEPMPPSAAQIAPDTLDTGVYYVTALADLPVYSGDPGDTRTQVNTVASGQTTMVTGISRDGKWWRVLCPGDQVGPCWATASSQQTRPRVVMPNSVIAPQTVFVQWKVLMALTDVPVYQGNPGDTQNPVITIAGGQMALVTGASSDGKWWRVVCPDDTVGNCWVSSQPDLTEPRAAPMSGPAYRWIKLRDARYGYGLAIPCYWTVYPTPSQGNYAAMSMRSYDDAYFLAHSEKGGWIGGKRPEGAVSMDMVVIEGIQPTLTLTEAVRQVATSDINLVQSIEPVTLGTNTGVLADVQSTQGPGANSPGPNHVVYFRLAPDKVLLAAVLPNTALTSADVQGILSSLKLSKQQDIVLPDTAPAPPLSEAPPACRP